MYKLAYNTNGLRNMDVVSAIKEVSKYGYEGIELSLHKAHLHPNFVTSNVLFEIKRELDNSGIFPACLATGSADLLSTENYEPSLISPKKEDRQMRIDCIKASIEIARQLEIPVVNISSGLKKSEVTNENARAYLIEGINECLKVCGNIILAIEPEPKMFIETSKQAIDIIKTINSSNLKLNLDIGHVVCCEDDDMKRIREACNYTAHVHIEDIKNRIHHHEIPGEGDIDLKNVLVILSEENYQGYVSVELYHHANVYKEALEKSHTYLRNIMNTLN